MAVPISLLAGQEAYPTVRLDTITGMRQFGLLFVCAAVLCAQTKTPEGTWDGTLNAGMAKLHLTLAIEKADDGLYFGMLSSADQGLQLPADAVTVSGNSVKVDMKAIRGKFEAELSDDGNELKGTWTQMLPLPLTLKRSEKAPEHPKPVTGPWRRIDVDNRIAPTVFAAGGRNHLCYELHITNYEAAPVHLRKIEVLGDGSPLGAHEGVELNGILSGSGASLDHRTLASREMTVAFLWIDLPAGAAPSKLVHRITVDNDTMDTEPLAVAKAKPIRIGPPLRGADWMAANGPGNTSGHRRALIPVNGDARISQRFAIDWVEMEPNSTTTFKGDPKDNKNYRAYGAEALAVADGVVSETKDGIPQNVPGITSRAVPITLETIGGNHVIIDLGDGHYAFYAHLQPGSLRVKLGDHVHRGQVIGLVGNSGNSTEPHLHFHISNANSPLGSEGLPYAIDSFEVMGGKDPEKRANEIPLQNDRVRFPD